MSRRRRNHKQSFVFSTLEPRQLFAADCGINFDLSTLAQPYVQQHGMKPIPFIFAEPLVLEPSPDNPIAQARENRLDQPDGLYEPELQENGVLRIDAVEDVDWYRVAESDGQVQVRIHANGETHSYCYSANDIYQISFYGINGNENFENETDIPLVSFWLQFPEVAAEQQDDPYRPELQDDGTLRIDAVEGVESYRVMGFDQVDVLVRVDGEIRVYSYSADQIKHIEFHGTDGDDSFENDTSIASTIYGYRGDDYLQGGDGGNTIYGGDGEDEIRGGTQRDTIYGGDQDDEIYGSSGWDDLYGGDGNDVISGGDGVDKIFGGNHHDRLYGDAGQDIIEGGKGNDSLYGGGDFDRLTGGEGADRFLRHLDGSLRSNYSELPKDYNHSEDVRIDFYKGKFERFWTSAEDSHYRTSGDWNHPEIKQVDEALADFVAITNDNQLLKKADGKAVDFYRFGQVRDIMPWGPLNLMPATNSGGNINIHDSSFYSLDHTVFKQMVYHEIGHNWDEPNENRFVRDFRAVGGWRFVPLPFLTNLDGMEQAKNNRYWFTDVDSDLDGFAADYGKTNPKEDFATSFAAWVTNYHGQTYVNKSGPESPWETQQRTEGRMEVLDQFFASLV